MKRASNRILYVVCMNHAVNDGSVFLLSSLFPVVIALFSLSVFQVGLLVAIGYFVSVIFQPILGRYSEGRDPRLLLALGISIISISIITFVLASDFFGLLSSVVLIRLGSSFFHPVGVSAVSRAYSGPRLDRSMGFLSAFGNFGILVVFLTAAPVYLALGWKATFLVFAGFAILDVAITLTAMKAQPPPIAEPDAKASSEKMPTSKGRFGISFFFVASTFISGGSYAVVVNFANILVQRSLLLSLAYFVAASTTFAFTLLSSNLYLLVPLLAVNGFALSVTYPLTYTELSHHLRTDQDRKGKSFGILFSAQTVGASVLGLVSGYVSDVFGLPFAFRVLAVLILAGGFMALLWARGAKSQQ